MNATFPIKLLIVNDQVLTRESLSKRLAASTELHIVGEADCGESALDLCAQLRPDIVLMGVALPGLDGLTVTQMIRLRFLSIRVLILTNQRDKLLVQIALHAGASGYLYEDIDADELIEAIRATAAGLSVFSPPAVAALAHQTDNAEALRQQVETDTDAASTTALQTSDADGIRDLFCSLTYRERQVLNLVLMGYTSAEIGSRLFISPRTAEKHRANMMNKLGARNQSVEALSHQLS